MLCRAAGRCACDKLAHSSVAGASAGFPSFCLATCGEHKHYTCTGSPPGLAFYTRLHLGCWNQGTVCGSHSFSVSDQNLRR
eukprot:356846-Chlamydomonas_euryale.AAC.1